MPSVAVPRYEALEGGAWWWHVTTSGIRAVLSWFRCSCKPFSLKMVSAQWISVFNCCSQYPCFNTCFLVLGSTSEDDFPLRKFVRGQVLDCKESRLSSDVSGNYPSGGTDVCLWAWRAGQWLSGYPSGRLVLRKVTSSANHEAVNLMVGSNGWDFLWSLVRMVYYRPIWWRYPQCTSITL